MAYNDIQATANRILGLKGDWNNATASGDNEKAKQIAANAQNYYKQLRDSGYEGMAQKLYDSNYEQSKNYINDYFAKQGRSAIRPYFYNLGQKYGLSKSDIDNALSFDEMTGEVSFGGKNIGKPEAISSDGVSYWNTDSLDNSFKDYVSRTGASRSASTVVRQENDNLAQKYNDLYDTSMQDFKDLKSTNPFETPEGKAILGKYDLSAIQGRNNQLATDAASNGGNVDSYSAANAMRQQASLYSIGQQAVMDAYNSKVANANTKLENARQLLSDMGVNISRVAADNETALNNQVSRDVATAEVTGKVPVNMSYANNPYFNPDGTLKNVDNVDYAAIIENAQAKLANTTDPSEKANLEATIKYARQARAYKILNNPAYNKYIDTMITPEVEETENARQFNKQIDSSEKLAQMGYEHEDKQLEMQNQQEKDMLGLNTDAAIRINNNETDNTIRANSAATNDSIRAAKAATASVGGSSSGSSSSNNSNVDASSLKITNDTDMYGNYNVNGIYYSTQEIVQGLQDGTFKYKDEGNGKIGIYSNTGAFVGAQQ